MKCIRCKYGCPTEKHSWDGSISDDWYCFFTNRTRIENVIGKISIGRDLDAECDLTDEELRAAWEYAAGHNGGR